MIKEQENSNTKEQLQINSQAYWNNRFDTDWHEFSGDEQTTYFATILNQMLPEWLIHEINESRETICDLGCAEGDALKIYKQIFQTSDILGEDFSQSAIQAAIKKYPEFSFKVSDILKPKGETIYPVVICSNVVEHFKQTYDVIAHICQRASKYAVIMMPYREEPGKIAEHEHSFHTCNIPARINDNYLVYARTMKCNSIYYPYEQILLIYAKHKNFYFMSDLVEYVESDHETSVKGKLEADIIENNNQILECAKQLKIKDEQLRDYGKQLKAYESQLSDYNKQLKDYEEKLIGYKEQIKHYEEQLKASDKQLITLQEVASVIPKYETQISEYTRNLDNLERKLNMSMALLRQKDEYIIQAQNYCDHFATGKLMKLNHMLFRIKGQLFTGNTAARKRFFTWLKGRIKGTNRTIGDGAQFNPWMIVKLKLSEALNSQAENFELFDEKSTVSSAMDISKSRSCNDNIRMLSDSTTNILHKDYTHFDVIILSVIDYDFRHQRPQHFATRFAANGHRVFYVNANFIRPDSVTLKGDNLYVVDFSNKEYNAIYAMNGKDTLDWMKEKLTRLINTQAIRDAVLIVDYPNWVYAAEHVRNLFGFKIITDYMDDYTGFLGTAEDFLKDNCIHLLRESNLVAASSQFLYDVACRYTNTDRITIIRNGTEVNHFYQAVNLQSNKSRKVIGYYGAVAHWFAWEKVCSLAKSMPECDIVIVGAVTEHREKLEKYNNIKLLGEKPYKELPKYLADFDVCLIPFDTSTDLIKATNPVKFYEYLSAGKKIVATEIPELMPFRDEYVYMSNDDQKFTEYVKACLDGTDNLKGMEECIAFAKENDWQKRFECFAEACRNQVPMVSVIVLTYNNLDLNKNCINSILNQTAYANYELIIVDNQSTDGTVEYLQELQQQNLPNLTIIFNKDNAGFAGGNNIGLRKAKGDYVLLLNNDTEVTRGWLTAMTKHLENNQHYGMCNPVTNSIGNESKIVVNYGNRHELAQFAYCYTMDHMGEEYRDVDRLPLFATLIRKDVIEKAGYLNEEYKVGMFEDDDYTERVLRSGYEIVIVEDAFIHHVNNASFKKLDDETYKKVFEENKKIFEKKWNKKWIMPKYREGVDWNSNKMAKLK